MKVLFDTNVVLDIALNRKPFVEDAALLWRLAEQKEITACLSNTSITDKGDYGERPELLHPAELIERIKAEGV